MKIIFCIYLSNRASNQHKDACRSTIHLLFNSPPCAISHSPALQIVNSSPSRYVACPSSWRRREWGKKFKRLSLVERLRRFSFLKFLLFPSNCKRNYLFSVYLLTSWKKQTNLSTCWLKSERKPFADWRCHLLWLHSVGDRWIKQYGALLE